MTPTELSEYLRGQASYELAIAEQVCKNAYCYVPVSCIDRTSRVKRVAMICNN